MTGEKRIVEVSIACSLGYEKIATASAAVVAKRMGFSKERIEDLKTALAEACIDAIERSYGEEVRMSVGVTLTIGGDTLQMDVVDSGKGEASDVRAPVLIGDRELGMFLIESLVDEVETIAGASGNQVRMIVHLVKD
jgi:serine/threonine-protein kinase RsbW